MEFNQKFSNQVKSQQCAKTGFCESYKDDKVNEFINLIRQKNFDGYIFGSPVHYAAPNGFIKPFMDRLFYVHFNSGNPFFNGKVAASVVNSRRAGATAAFKQLNQNYSMSNFPVVSS